MQPFVSDSYTIRSPYCFYKHLGLTWPLLLPIIDSCSTADSHSIGWCCMDFRIASRQAIALGIWRTLSHVPPRELKPNPAGFGCDRKGFLAKPTSGTAVLVDMAEHRCLPVSTCRLRVRLGEGSPVGSWPRRAKTAFQQRSSEFASIKSKYRETLFRRSSNQRHRLHHIQMTVHYH